MLKFLLIAAGMGIGIFAIFCIVYYFRCVKEPSDSQETYSSPSYPQHKPVAQRTLELPNFTGLFAFDTNQAHVYFFETPNNFYEYYINSTGRRCVSIGKYWHFGNGCFLIRYDDVQHLKNIDDLTEYREQKSDDCYTNEIYISYTVNRQGFFVAFKWHGDTLEERLNTFLNYASTHYNWGAQCSKQKLSLDDYEKMIIRKHLYRY